MRAIASFCFEDGMRTLSCSATLALRMRVSMSAIGSVIVIVRLPSPARLRDTGHFAGVHHLAQADAAEPELAEVRARAPATAAPVVRAHLVLGLALLLLDECFLRHACYCPSRLNGKPNASRRALPSASERAVVTIVMSMPRGESTLS